jgi:sugar-specific transcriptional regulator TrmB
VDASVNHNAVTRPLELLGIGATEERAYRALIERHMATAAEIAESLGLSLRVARKLLADLEALGLATHTPKVPRVYVAAPPEFAVAALIRQQQAMLERVRVAIPDLEEQSARSNRVGGQEPVLELITSRTHLGAVMTQLYESFRSEAMCFQRAPTLTPTVMPPRRARSGARVRTVSDNSILETPGTLARIKQDVAEGEQARMLPSLPFKMMIFDRRAAVIALDGENPESAPTLLIHGSALLKALCRLFEFVWERATPIMFGRPDIAGAGTLDARSGEMADALIPLLAAGLNDKAIAMELGISPATLNRRMSELMRATGTRTRFQLGWRAALDAAQSNDGHAAAAA